MAYVKNEEADVEESTPVSSSRQSSGTGSAVTNRGNLVDEKVVSLEDIVGKVLRWGSLLSVATILVGLVGVAWYTHVAAGPQILLIPVVGSHDLNTPAGLLSRIRGGDPTAIISLGLLVLIATPVLRVASTVVYFFLKKDLTYLAVTSFVLLVLIAGFLLGSTAG